MTTPSETPFEAPDRSESSKKMQQLRREVGTYLQLGDQIVLDRSQYLDRIAGAYAEYCIASMNEMQRTKANHLNALASLGLPEEDILLIINQIIEASILLGTQKQKITSPDTGSIHTSVTDLIDADCI